MNNDVTKLLEDLDELYSKGEELLKKVAELQNMLAKD